MAPCRATGAKPHCSTRLRMEAMCSASGHWLVLINPAETLESPAMATMLGKQPGERRDQERWDRGRR